jgi:hypothetical protein
MVLRLQRIGPVSPLYHAFTAITLIFLPYLTYCRLYDAAVVAKVAMTYCFRGNYE